MKPCEVCGQLRRPRKSRPDQLWCPTCDKRRSKEYDRRAALKKYPDRKWPWGTGAAIARQLGVNQQTVSAVMNGACTSRRISEALEAVRRASA